MRINISRSDKAKSMIGFVPDTPDLYENFQPVSFLSLYRSRKIDFKLPPAIDNLLGLFDCEQARRAVWRIFYGMRQKICIAAALLGNPVLFRTNLL